MLKQFSVKTCVKNISVKNAMTKIETKKRTQIHGSDIVCSFYLL